MKKVIIANENEIMDVLMSGHVVKGRLGMKTNADGSMAIEFVAYRRSRRAKERLICYLEHGWVKESPERIKVFESLPKRLGGVRMAFALEREMETVADMLSINE